MSALLSPTFLAFPRLTFSCKDFCINFLNSLFRILLFLVSIHHSQVYLLFYWSLLISSPDFRSSLLILFHLSFWSISFLIIKTISLLLFCLISVLLVMLFLPTIWTSSLSLFLLFLLYSCYRRIHPTFSDFFLAPYVCLYICVFLI